MTPPLTAINLSSSAPQASQTEPGAVAPPGRRPRVLHCITALALGGAERATLSLVHELGDRLAFGVHTLRRNIPDAVGRGFRAELAAAGVPWFRGTRWPVKAGGLVTGGLSLAAAVRKFQPDLVHLHTEIPEASYAAMILLRPRLRRLPLARTIHNSFYWHHWTRIGLWAERRMPAAHIVGVSEAAVAAYLEFSRRAGTRPLSSRVIYNGSLPPGSLRPARPQDGPLRALFAGRFEFQKGADLLPDILAQISPDVAAGCELTIMGDGFYAALLAQLAASPPPGWRIRLAAPQPDLAARLDEFDLVLMPSRFEGLSMIAIETLLRGIPVIGTDAPGLREAFPPGYPWLAAPGDPADFARIFQAACRCRGEWDAIMTPVRAGAVERFSLARSAARYLEFYHRALAS